MSPHCFAPQTDFNTIWLNCTEEQIEQVHIIYFYIRDATTFGRMCVCVCTLYSLYSMLNDADGF